uniref:Serine carboxypeptidase-like protein 8 n=1 Tax=Aegilops tauschii TaxID=37682 RepID=M8CA92_AEGTA
MASIIFLDSPVCSGFSYARDPKGCDVGDYSSSLQVQRFLNKGYLIGNPITDPKFEKNFQVQGAHGFGIISDQIYEAAMKNCKGNYVKPANQLCAEVLETIDNLISEITDAHVLYKKCVVATPKPIDDATYGYYLAYFWMNNRMTRDALGIKGGTVGEWVRCKKELPYTQDMPSSIPYHLNLTTRGYRALVYRFTITYANNLTFATVKGGGHTAPEYQPEECFAMAQRWLDNKPL